MAEAKNFVRREAADQKAVDAVQGEPGSRPIPCLSGNNRGFSTFDLVCAPTGSNRPQFGQLWSKFPAKFTGDVFSDIREIHRKNRETIEK